MWIAWAISLRYFLSRRQGGALSFITAVAVLGVTLGVGALVVAMAAMNGFEANMLRAMSGALPHVEILAGSELELAQAKRLVESLEGNLKPRWSSTYLSQETLLRRADKPSAALHGVRLRAVDFSAEGQDSSFVAFLDDGAPDWKRLAPEERQRRAEALVRRLAAARDTIPVLISRELAEKLGVAIGGDLLPFEFPAKGGDGFSPRPAAARLTVAGYFSTGIPVFDDLVALAPYARTPLLGRESAREYSLGLRLADPLLATRAADALRLASERQGRASYVYSWLESNQKMFQFIVLQKRMLFLVLLLIVVIAFFGMISALVMLVTEKTREITILKSLGLEERYILRIFMLQGMLIGLLGTALGTALGLGLCWVLDTFPIIQIPPGVYPGSDRMPVLVAAPDIALIVGVTLLVCLAATVFPSRKAVSLKPVDGLRVE